MELKIKTLPVSEENYEETMLTKVEPFLKEAGGDGYFESFDGNKIHYEHYRAEDPAGVVVIVHGFTESAEKFREMSYCYLQMGFSVYAIDNRGHGKSYRLNPHEPETVAIGKFTDYVQDLNGLMTKVVLKESGDLPLYLYAHSMGGAISVQYLQTYPGVFKKAVLSSPMIKAVTAGIPPKIVGAIAVPMLMLGKGNARPGFMGGFDFDRTYEDSHDTSKARFDYYQKKRVADPLLRTNTPSYRWAYEAVKVTDKNLDPKRNAKITIPVLLCQPEEDSAVYPDAEEKFVMQLPNGRLRKFTDCRHEIYASVDATVLEYLQAIEAFLKED